LHRPLGRHNKLFCPLDGRRVPNGRNAPRSWLPSARMARTNWSRAPSYALVDGCPDFTCTALYQPVRSIFANT
jgi:hypothetical protein